MVWLHALVTGGFWAVWLALVVTVSGYVADHRPELGALFGLLGALMLFLPTASLLAWDAIARLGGQARGPAGHPIATSEGYVAFSWRRLLVNAVGITLIGIGFGVSQYAGG